jgi:hypothetical protein
MLKTIIAVGIISTLFTGCVSIPDGNNLYEQRGVYSSYNNEPQEPVYIQRNYQNNNYYNQTNRRDHELSRNKNALQYESERNSMYVDKIKRDYDKRDDKRDDKRVEKNVEKNVEKPQSMSSTEDPNKRKRGSGMGD